MTVDYDTQRRTRHDEPGEPLDELAARRAQVPARLPDVDDGDPVDSYDLPDVDLTGEELMMKVLPKQADEFTCMSCFLVHHRSRLAQAPGQTQICTDCA